MKEIFVLCPRIANLNLRACRKLSNAFPALLAQNLAPDLVSLNLGGNYNIDDAGVRQFLIGFSNISRLRELNLSGLQISDATILLIAEKCTSLTSLGLGYLDLRESTYLALLNRLGSQLDSLDLSWPSAVVGAANAQLSADFLINSLTNLCPRITSLDLSGNKNVTFDVLRELLERKFAQVNPSPLWSPHSYLQCVSLSAVARWKCA